MDKTAPAGGSPVDNSNAPAATHPTGQAAPAENGPWVFNGSGVPLTRPTDFNVTAEVRNGSTRRR